AARVLAGEEPAREREVREEAEPEPLACGQHLVLWLALDERVLVLDGDEPREAALAGDVLRLLDLRGREVRAAGPAHRALPHELVQRAERLLDRRRRTTLVELVNVDRVGAEAAERALDRPADVLGAAGRVVGALVHLHPELRGEDDR